MQKRTAIITLPSLPSDTSREYFEDPDTGEKLGLESVYVELGAAYAELRCVGVQTAVNASTLPGPIEDHLNSFTLVEPVK